MHAPETHMTTHTKPIPGTLRKLVLAAALVALAGGVAAAPARADDGWRHGRHGHEWRGHHRPHVYVAPRYPGYVYAPPPVIYRPPPAVVYAPPRVVYAPPPVVFAPPGVGVKVVFPINIR
jgi:hypothetical protein